MTQTRRQKYSGYMRAKDMQAWSSYPDFRYFRKTVGQYVVELYYGTSRGGVILIWEKGIEKLDYIWPSNDSKTMHKSGEINFMDWDNAKLRYSWLKTTKDIIDIMSENLR